MPDRRKTVEATLAFPTTVTRRFAIVVEGLAPDPLVLAGPPRGLVRPGDTLVPLRIDGIRPAGPPIEVRFTDCLDVEHIISIPRTEASATVSLDPGSVVRTTLEAACVTPVVSPIVDFQVGLNVAGRFEPAATLVELSFLP